MTKEASANIYCWPTGTGKTRAVWEHILKKAGVNLRSPKELKRILSQTLIIGPNQRIKSTWETELEALLGEQDIEITAISYGDFYLKNGHINNEVIEKKYIVFDEWHRISQKIRTKIISKSSLTEDNDENVIVNKSKILSQAREVFFVSATPLRPATETFNGFDDNDPEDKKYQTSLENIRNESQKMIMALCGIKKSIKKDHFREIKEFKFEPMPRYELKNSIKPHKIMSKEPFLSPYEFITQGDWSLEYAMLNHIYGLTKNDKISQKKTDISFGETSYAKTYKINNDMNCPIEYMNEKSGKFKLLKKEIKSISKEKGSKNILIFCSHQATQIALKKGLEDSFKNITVIDDNSKENLDRFNDPDSEDKPFIMIATEKSQESIDLHKNCHHIIHYELPWCPISLIQRVGRLTRIIVSEKNELKINKTQVKHIIHPKSVEEERVNRLIRRMILLDHELNLAKGWGFKKIDDMIKKYFGDGNSAHLDWVFSK